MFFWGKYIQTKRVVLCFVIIIFILCIWYFGFSSRNFLNTSSEGVSKIVISIGPNAYKNILSGSASIEGELEIKNVVNVLNGIRIKHGNYSLDGLARDELCTRVYFYEGHEVINEIYFYYDLVYYNEECYGMNAFESYKLIDLCKQYGKVDIEEYNDWNDN